MSVRTGRVASAGLPLALIVSFLCVSAAPSPGRTADDKSAAKLVVSPEVHDFGNVGQDQRLVHEFTIVNEGNQELSIGRISTSCGCAAALAAQRTVAPGESTTLTVTLETRKYRGTLERSVSVSSNDPARISRVKVQAFVEHPES